MVTWWSSPGWIPTAVSIVSVLQIRICVRLSANGCERTQLHRPTCVFRGMAVILCNDIFLRCLSLGICFPPLSAVYYFLLRTVLCLRISSFLYPALNDWPFMKYASNYFFFPLCAVSLPTCPVLPPLSLNWSSHARALSLFFLSVSCSRVSWIGHPLPSLSHHLA